MNKKKLVVIGGGAAGFFCAINAAKLKPELEIIILEKTGKLLSKVKVSGGGRCNVTHSCFSIGDMIKKYPRGDKFLKKAFHHFFTTDTINWCKSILHLRTASPDSSSPRLDVRGTTEHREELTGVGCVGEDQLHATTSTVVAAW